MHAIFRICGNESQPRLQIVEKLATPLIAILNTSWLNDGTGSRSYAILFVSNAANNSFPKISKLLGSTVTALFIRFAES